MSLRLRLALLYAALTGVVVLVVSLGAYAIHSRGQYDELDGLLQAAALHVDSEHLGEVASGQSAGLVLEPSTPDVVLLVYDGSGALIQSSPSSAPLPLIVPQDVLRLPPPSPYDGLVALAPSLSKLDPGPGAFSVLSGPDGSRWRVYLLPVDGSAYYIVAAASLQHLDASASELRLLAPLLAGLTALLTFVSGGLIAGQALRPVASLTETANAIARSRAFDRRVDVTGRGDELGRLATTFNEMLDSLEQAYRAQQRFVSDASHELRAPLTVIQANLDLLERQPGMSSEESGEAVSEAAREARRLASLVSELLVLARADAGVKLPRGRVELDRVVLEALGEARHLARGQRVEVERLDPALVDGDSDRLKQLTLILLDNALKYTPRGKRVVLGVRRNGRWVEVTVRDEGMGIDPQDLPRVFERFYRGEGALALAPEGSGLGLPIASSIVREYGGDVTLTSKLGQGTTVTVRMPVSG